MTEKPKIIFMGTPEFAVPTLRALNTEFSVNAVVTVPDKPQGRGKKLQPSAVKVAAQELALPLLQPESLKDEGFIEQIRQSNPDLIVVLAFRILPPAVYNLPKICSFNIHSSLLPKYRGAAPINWAIINGDKTSGVTSFKLQEKVDTGEIILQRQIDIPQNSTAGDLHDLLMELAPALAIDTSNLLLKGDCKYVLQDNSLATPAPKIFREQCKIEWNTDVIKLKNFISGVSPVPAAWTIFNGKNFKILRTDFIKKVNTTPGKFEIKNKSIYIDAVGGQIIPLEIQPEGKSPMPSAAFVNGYRGALEGMME